MDHETVMGKVKLSAWDSVAAARLSSTLARLALTMARLGAQVLVVKSRRLTARAR